MPEEQLNLLHTCLLDLLHELRQVDLKVILGGGYGLYLKQLHMQESGQRTLIDGALWPRPRATEDLDIMLGTEIIVDAERTAQWRGALERLGYASIPGAEHYQFVKPLPNQGRVKIDLLIGALGEVERDERLRVDDRRVRPRKPKGLRLHAHRTDEAIAYEENLTELPVSGVLSTGESFTGQINIPQPFTLLLMKLFAFRDRNQDADKGFARHHALDLYRIVAMLTEAEYELARRQVLRFASDDVVVEARRIVSSLFTTPETIGALRLREHQLFQPEMDTVMFLSTLQEFFPPLTA